MSAAGTGAACLGVGSGAGVGVVAAGAGVAGVEAGGVEAGVVVAAGAGDSSEAAGVDPQDTAKNRTVKIVKIRIGNFFILFSYFIK